MNFPNPEQTSLIRKTKEQLVANLNKKMDIFGPYEKRLDNWYVSGGCVASLLRGEEPNDYDIYFRTKETMDHVVALITGSPDLMQHVANVEEKYREVLGKDGKCITENAITMKNGLQFITKHYGDDIAVRDTFDFVHCMPVYTLHDKRLRISEEQFECCVNKILKINNQGSWTRHRQEKFEKLGYHLAQTEAIQVIEDDWLTKLFGGK